MAQEHSVLWVIDGLVMDTTTAASGEIATNSIKPWLERYFPLIKVDAIKEIRLLRSSDIAIGIGHCNPDDKIIIITT